MILALASIASAATVAVLDFDGYGVSFTEAQTVTQGVRDAFLEEGKLDPLSGSDIADGVSKDQESALRRARELVAEGRRLYMSGDPGAAVAPLTEAVGLHEAAFSDVGRRPEMADAAFLLGSALLKAGRSTEARAKFDTAVWLVPHYAAERGTKMDSAASTMLAQAEGALTDGPRKVRSADAIGGVAEALHVDYVVTGSIVGDGTVYAKMYAGDRLVSEVKGHLDEMPPLPIDEGYVAVAKKLVSAGLGAPVAAPKEEPEEEPEELTDEPPPDFGEGEVASKPTKVAKDRPVTTKIKTSGSMKYKRPVTERWWFWASAVAVAGGGGVGIWYALTPPPTEIVVEPNEWSVTVVTE